MLWRTIRVKAWDETVESTEHIKLERMIVVKGCKCFPCIWSAATSNVDLELAELHFTSNSANPLVTALIYPYSQSLQLLFLCNWSSWLLETQNIMGKKRRIEIQAHTTKSLPEGCHHYEEVGDVPWDIQKWLVKPLLLSRRCIITFLDTSHSGIAYFQNMTKEYGWPMMLGLE